MSFPDKINTDSPSPLNKEQKTDFSVEHSGITYEALGNEENLQKATEVLHSSSFEATTTLPELKEKIKDQADISFPVAKTNTVGTETLHTKGEIQISNTPRLAAGVWPEGKYLLASENRNIQFYEKNGQFFEIGIVHPEEPTECIPLKNGAFQLKDLPITLKYDKYSDSLALEENRQIVHTLKAEPANVEEVIEKLCMSFEKYYVNPEISKECSDYLRKQLNNGTYGSISDPKKLCEALTDDLRLISGDVHIRVVLPSTEPEPSVIIEETPTQEDLDGPYPLPKFDDKPMEYKSTLNGGDKWIPHEIQTGFLKDNPGLGYIDLRGDIRNCKYLGVPETELDHKYMNDFERRKAAIIAAVNNIKTAKTVIIDLRNCGGGHFTGVHLLSSLFLENKRLTRREWRDGSSEEANTLSNEELPTDQRLLKQMS